MSSNQLILGDCLKELPNLPDASIDFICTDPPYGHSNNDGDLIHNREKALGEGKKRLVRTKNGQLVPAGSKARPVQNEARPIANDKGEEADLLLRRVLKQSKRLLVPGGNVAVCCGGGGSHSRKDNPHEPSYAWWSIWMDRVLQFKQMIVWDKGPMGMGWHYRRSYEVVLVASKKGGKYKWYDETDKVENIIRPGDHGITKIIPSGPTYGLHSSCTVSAGELECDEKTELVRLLKRVTSDIILDVRVESLCWSTGGSGRSITVRCPTVSLSTTLTRIKEIIGSKTSNSSMPLRTKESTQDVGRTPRADGGSPAGRAVFSNWLKKTITSTQAEGITAFTRSVRHAVFDVLCEISNEEKWQQDVIDPGCHPTPKPVELAMHFIRLHTQEGDTVLDPFMGAGWVGVACKLMGRKFIGIEIDPQWYEMAKRRITRVKSRSDLKSRKLIAKHGDFIGGFWETG